MAQEKIVKLKIGNTIKHVPESEVPKWVENQQRVVNQLVEKGASREEAEKFFRAEILNP